MLRTVIPIMSQQTSELQDKTRMAEISTATLWQIFPDVRIVSAPPKYSRWEEQKLRGKKLEFHPRLCHTLSKAWSAPFALSEFANPVPNVMCFLLPLTWRWLINQYTHMIAKCRPCAQEAFPVVGNDVLSITASFGVY